jgi:tripartite-type tricarboxylate transporter receptor subunit TctC
LPQQLTGKTYVEPMSGKEQAGTDITIKKKEKDMSRLPKVTVTFFLFFVFLCLFFGAARSQDTDVSKFPTGPINFITSLPAGSVGDVSSRLISKEAEKTLGKPVIVVNKPGGSHAIGATAIAKAKPDGYTLGYVTPSALFTVPFFEKLSYDPVKDLQGIMQYSETRFGVITGPDAPFKTFKELIDYARKNPGKVTYGTGGTNSIANINIEKIAREEGVRFTHIPFKGGTDYQTALMGGHVMFAAGEISAPMIEAGKIRLLLLFTEKKLPEYPQVPILKELGYKTSYPSFIGVMGPKGIPEGIVKKLEDAFTGASKQPSVVKGLKDLQLSEFYRTGRELTEFIAYHYDLYAQLLKEMNLIK